MWIILEAENIMALCHFMTFCEHRSKLSTTHLDSSSEGSLSGHGVFLRHSSEKRGQVLTDER